MEQRPEQSPAPDTFDAWLTGLPDEELTRLSDLTDQLLAEITDEAGAAAVLDMAMRFRGTPDMSAEEIEDAFSSFSIQLALERMVRDGDAIKEGTYTMTLGEEFVKGTLTEQGKQKQADRWNSGTN